MEEGAGVSDRTCKRRPISPSERDCCCAKVEQPILVEFGADLYPISIKPFLGTIFPEPIAPLPVRSSLLDIDIPTC